MELAARDLLKLGQLYLNGGIWNGERVIDEFYVRTATSPLMDGGLPERCGYGLLWWVADRASPPHYFAGGYGGQYIMILHDLDVVAVTMGDADAMTRPSAGPHAAPPPLPEGGARQVPFLLVRRAGARCLWSGRQVCAPLPKVPPNHKRRGLNSLPLIAGSRSLRTEKVRASFRTNHRTKEPAGSTGRAHGGP